MLTTGICINNNTFAESCGVILKYINLIMGVIRQLRKVCIASTRSTDTDDQTTNTSTDDEGTYIVSSLKTN